MVISFDKIAEFLFYQSVGIDGEDWDLFEKEKR
jgi:hypothetical protein